MLGHDIKCISTVDWVLKKNKQTLTYIIKCQSFTSPFTVWFLHSGQEALEPDTCIYMPGMPLTGCVILGKSFTSYVSLTRCDPGQIT